MVKFSHKSESTPGTNVLCYFAITVTKIPQRNSSREEKMILAYGFRELQSTMAGKACLSHGSYSMWQKLLPLQQPKKQR